MQSVVSLDPESRLRDDTNVANNVIFINQWWNPSSNAQARDRVVRIGQTKTVRIKSFTCRGTVEDRLQTILEEKSPHFQ